ncbi:inositol monophosphatase family protein [Rhodovibrio sodomensis]|uniref:inositol monophosphatase family protein n=1 Tax=Rhodovibrio sodomensis TaxID=1088 RepID=UPI0030841248
MSAGSGFPGRRRSIAGPAARSPAPPAAGSRSPSRPSTPPRRTCSSRTIGRASTRCPSARLRRFGGDCYQYGRLALGELDLVAEADLKPYDYLALVPVIEGAGGTVTDWAGGSLDLDSDGRVLAAGSAALHAEALGILGA